MLTFHPGSSFCLKCSKGTIFQQLVSCTNVTWDQRSLDMTTYVWHSAKFVYNPGIHGVYPNSILKIISSFGCSNSVNLGWLWEGFWTCWIRLISTFLPSRSDLSSCFIHHRDIHIAELLLRIGPPPYCGWTSSEKQLSSFMTPPQKPCFSMIHFIPCNS